MSQYLVYVTVYQHMKQMKSEYLLAINLMFFPTPTFVWTLTV